MGFAGHNRGKKFVAGVGYVDPPERPRRERLCEQPDCRRPAWRWFSWCGFTCKKCWNLGRAWDRE